MILLDTNVLIQLDSVQLPPDDVALSAIVYAELQLGVERATDPVLRRSRRNELMRLSSLLEADWLPFDRAAAEGYARLASEVILTRPAHARSKDLMLAGHAYALGAALLTFNPKDFELVSGDVEIIVPELR
ncbi:MULTISPECIES: PIN domain-containing protein [Microbacterium]|uniref:PIN domain-containing protein n=1 Tax=Microbacterium TaxID=33882 RepID=UPI00041EC0DC|nr:MULTISPECIES: PIN domain-containing protein [Microbacterium]MCV0334989.1 PIN domain-containing protein [Microbacterium sp.]MCV0376614.1 PIN domain-containing protein [Microbacterium sp.]MCV0391043.1 PIN domain-containing protein [Microbacterium sp.]MCV0420185.1 PIN domain-containing protein [Microbacterium sp.]MCV0422883.1 PIN domain-containing protein [Microbacterium sp.]